MASYPCCPEYRICQNCYDADWKIITGCNMLGNRCPSCSNLITKVVETITITPEEGLRANKTRSQLRKSFSKPTYEEVNLAFESHSENSEFTCESNAEFNFEVGSPDLFDSGSDCDFTWATETCV